MINKVTTHKLSPEREKLLFTYFTKEEHLEGNVMIKYTT